MSGQDLYEAYVRINEANGVGCDGWDDIGDREQAVWGQLAEFVNNR